jgi:uncharacterized damage-inducible protein DinB
MNLPHHLTETFLWNDKANKMVLKKAEELRDKTEFTKFFSHLINSQLKWMARIMQEPNAPQMDWWNPVYEFHELEKKWDESLKPWLDYIATKTEEELMTEVTFIGFDGSLFAATPADIMLQLNYHSIHHRAQIQTMIRQQGLEPEFVDYIGTRYRRVG